MRGSERFFIVANYEKSRKKAISYINNKLTISNEKININKLDKSFETIIPFYLDGVPLKNIYIETRNTSTPLLNNQLIKKFL